MKLPHGRELIAFLPMSDLYAEYAEHERLQVFVEYGLECVTCPRVGTFLVLSRETANSKQSRKRNTVNKVHIDIYTDDFILMTVDHVIPKAVARLLGWTKEEVEALTNKQPMCEPCNGSKSDKPLSNEELAERRAKANNHLRIPDSIAKLLVENIHELLGDRV